ncbi:hypothetical protein G4B88_026607 [Cannabis sativa]|uniref:RNase H type-1 domain-containing protein n=1 Tax=Cannabis sativa TaxID=3483 RepID=A0A7J6GQW3_CANSA|nr:hypothetical protein G4B88_026607 [Cannabis sativa]
MCGRENIDVPFDGKIIDSACNQGIALAKGLTSIFYYSHRFGNDLVKNQQETIIVLLLKLCGLPAVGLLEVIHFVLTPLETWWSGFLSPDFLQGADEDDFDLVSTWRGVFAKVNNVAANLRAAWESLRVADVLQQNLTEIYTGKLVLLVDAAFKDMRAATGIVASVSEAKSWALINAVKWCNLRGWRQVVIASDCQLLVHGLHARRAPDWRLAVSFWALAELLDDLPEVEIVWTPHAGVQVAHNLAQWAFCNSFSGFLNAEDLAPLVAINKFVTVS